MTKAVEAVGLSRRYGSLIALDGLTFELEAGTVFGVLGPNGAGKTTAIRVLTTVLQPTQGSFAVAGIPHTRPKDIRRRIGVLPESAGYPERQTGEEFLRYHARLFGHSGSSAAAVALALLKEIGLDERSRSLISTYSRGMRQRLGIARALVNEPEVVFLDEPTLGLDPAGQRQILTMVRRVAATRGTTVLLSTHLLAEVEETCSSVLVLNQGRSVAQGTISEITRRAAAPRTARLRVPIEHVARALEVLRGASALERVALVDGQTGLLSVTIAEAEGLDGAGLMNHGLRLLVDAGIPILSFEFEGARLSDAFLAMTGAT